MLTPEERQRIEDEERKRHAEEQYRAEVRANLQQQSQPANQAPAPVKTSNPIGWILGIAAVLVIGFLAIINTSTSRSKGTSDSAAPLALASSKPAPEPVPEPVLKTRYVPVSQKIATGQIIVKAHGFVQYRITIDADMIEPEVVGTFNASGGTGNDITAVIADEMNYTNWINGHESKVFWGTQGKQTTGNFSVRLRPGQYYLVFSNKFSSFTDKQVFLEVDLNHKKAEAYY